MKTAAAALAAVLMIAGCGGSENTDPGVATAAIDAAGVHCNAPDLETEFGTEDPGFGTVHLCRWDCIDYHGETGRMVTLEWHRPFNEHTGAPYGEWSFYNDKSEPSPSCPQP